jgi:hypothetical protein
MNSLSSGINFNEVMAVLDIVKNESVYNERLAKLKEAEERLNASRFTVTTMEQASLVLERAKEEEEKYKVLIKNSKEEIETLRKQRLEDLQKKEDILCKRETAIKDLEESLRAKISLVDKERESISERLLEIRKEQIETETINKESRLLRNNLEEKMKKIRQIINE